MLRLMTCVSGTAKRCALRLINNAGMQSRPCDFFPFNFSSSESTSTVSTCSKPNVVFLHPVASGLHEPSLKLFLSMQANVWQAEGQSP